jgi:Putative translation initiation inhibitor, yjgF family
MTSPIEQRLLELGLRLPELPAPAGNYVPWVRAGKLLFVSGQVPMAEGRIVVAGRLGENVSLEEGQRAARLCALNILAQARAALDGDLTGLARCVKLGGFVACTADFTDQPRVINGASDLMVAAMGEAGRHARFAVGAPALPLGAAVEVEAVFELA